MKNWPREPLFIGDQKLAVMTQNLADDLSFDLSVDQPTVIFITVGVAGRPLSRPHPGLDLSVDRGKIQRAKLSGR